MDFWGRKELFRALVGSHNYNLNTPDSDKDYKIFVAPTFDDLYFNKQFSDSKVGREIDYDIHDIRHMSKLFWKSNINFVEVLFSEDIKIAEDIDSKTRCLLSDIFAMKNDIAKMNLPYLYDACIGMHINKKKQIDKGTVGTQYLVDKYGYDTKQAQHSMRVLNFLRRFALNGFSNFKDAIWYKEDNISRSYLLKLKGGGVSKDSYCHLSDSYLKFTERDYKEKYKSYSVDVKTNDKLIDIIKEIVKLQI